MSFFKYSKLKRSEFTGLSTFQILTFFRRSIVYTFLSIYLKSLGLSTTEVTLMATVGMIANTATQSLLWGNLLDKYRKPMEFVAIGELLAGVGHFFMVIGYMFFLGLNQLFVAGYVIIFSLGGIEVFWSMSNVGWSALVSELTEDDERKKLMGQLSTIGGFGGIGGAILGGLLFDVGGFANGSIFNLAAVIMILSSFIVYFSIRLEKENESWKSDDSEVSENHSLRDLPSQLRLAYLIFIIALVFINFGRNSIAIITSLFLADPTGFNASGVDIGLYSNVRSVANMVAGLAVGSVVAKTDDRKVMMAGIIFSIVGILWLIITPSFTLALIESLLRGASEVIIGASSYSIVARMAPKEYRGRLFAYYNTTFFLSWGIAATLVAGPVADLLIAAGLSNADAYRGSFMAALVLISIGVIVLLMSFRYSLKNEIVNETDEDAGTYSSFKDVEGPLA
ncbi:MAG: MFS transporter [Candidatus Thorarchaeota archaeon SMTZ1-45]